MANEREPITAEELEDIASYFSVREEGDEIAEPMLRSASTIRALQSDLAEARKREVPEGTYSLCWRNGDLECSLEECTDGRWSWMVEFLPKGDEGPLLVDEGYRKTREEALDAIAAAESAAKEGDNE